VLPAALRDKAKYDDGYPWGLVAHEQWERRLETMARGFDAARRLMERQFILGVDDAAMVKAFRRGWKLMGYWFWRL
jgi:hypothetical protein